MIKEKIYKTGLIIGLSLLIISFGYAVLSPLNIYVYRRNIALLIFDIGYIILASNFIIRYLLAEETKELYAHFWKLVLGLLLLTQLVIHILPLSKPIRMYLSIIVIAIFFIYSKKKKLI